MDEEVEYNTNEKRVDSKILPELYQVSDMGRIKRKSIWLDRTRTRTAFDGVEVIDKAWYQTKENILAPAVMNTWYVRIDLRYMKNLVAVRKSALVHRLVYCSFNNIPLEECTDVWHHNDIPTDNRLEIYTWLIKRIIPTIEN